jgi:serine/tyrosine/threonine adenylyltransferase
MLREYLISEAMAALRIPTTRSLAVVATGETILRDQGPVPGAVLARVAASHIRVGTFQFFAARGEVDKLRALLDYSIARHYPQVQGAMEFFAAVVQAQARLVAQWMGVGFVHGVMNTDNMAISGETIDYGPCAFMEAYAPGTVFSSIDRQGRYAYGNQPAIMGWNLARLAESLLPFIDPDPERAVDQANAALEGIAGIYRAEFLRVMRGKLALQGEAAGDEALIEAFLAAIQGVDWTLAHRRLAGAVTADEGYLALFDQTEAIKAWLPQWRSRLRGDAVAALLTANPVVIPRNHLVEEALDAASEGDMGRFDALLAEVRDPFGSEAGREGFALPAPKGFESYVTYCGT